MAFDFTAQLWAWKPEEPGSWTFLSLPSDVADEIRDEAEARGPRGFGSVKVAVTLGGSTWQTSVFPDAASGTYLLPIKKAIRTSEGIESGDQVRVHLDLA